jgi:hypothetical protein
MSEMIQVPFGDTIVSRFKPAGPVSAYKTYAMNRPHDTHSRPATCEEIDCDFWRHGWVTTLDISTTEGQFHFETAKAASRTRPYSLQRVTDHLLKLLYKPGTPCFKASQHRVPVERPSIFVVRDGDFRGNPTGRRRVRRAEDWVDDFANHEDRLETARQRG